MTELLKVAEALVLAANKQVDENMPERLALIVKQHAAAGVVSAWVPVPGASIAIGIAAVWGMYYRINNELQLPFSENVTKSIASGVATNLTAYLSILTVGEVLKFIPGIGSLVSAVLLSAAQYALMLTSGYIYMKILIVLFNGKDISNVSNSDIEEAMNNVLKDKKDIESFASKAKDSYKK